MAMTKKISLLKVTRNSLLMLTLLIAGCAVDPGYWNGHNKFHNEISFRDLNYQLNFDENKTSLSKKQVHMLKGAVTKANNVELVYLSPCPASSEYGNQKRVKAVAKVVKELGYTPIVATTPPLSQHPSTCVNITLRQIFVIPPHCPNLVSPGSNYYKISSNFGCSSVRNLGVMVAYPQELLDPGRGTGDVPSNRQILAIQDYNKGVVKKLYSSESETESVEETSDTGEGGEGGSISISK